MQHDVRTIPVKTLDMRVSRNATKKAAQTLQQKGSSKMTPFKLAQLAPYFKHPSPRRRNFHQENDGTISLEKAAQLSAS